MHARTIRAALSLVAAALAGTMTAGCYPDRILSLSDATVVSTIHDDGVSRTAHTFAMPDTVVHALRRANAGVIGHEADDMIIARIADDLTALGWQRLSPYSFALPDVVVLPIVFESPNDGVAYPGWWDDWSFWPGWPLPMERGWNVPRTPIEFTYETGTLLIVMLDTRGSSNLQLPVLWAAGIHGAFYSTATTAVLSHIDQAFRQSPYLERTQ